MKSQHYLRITKFMELAGQTVRTKPTIPTLEERKLRAKLILEEALETVEALGFSVDFAPDVETETISIEHLQFVGDVEPNLVEIADGCADISVVTVGTMISCGFPDIELLRMVDDNNLGKFGPGSRNENGKHIKPPGHPKPPIGEWLSTL